MELKPQSSPVNGPLWSRKARDWAEAQEVQAIAAYEAVLDRAGVGPGTRYLDVGCGAGVAAGLASARGARTSGIDAAEGMIAVARDGAQDVDFRVGDLEALPYATESFDVVTGFNAFQYAANPAVALREAGRVTKAGGLIVVMAWGPPESTPAASLLMALAPLLPPPPPGAPGPFALSVETALRAFAADAGLQAIEVFDVDSPFDYPDEATALRGLNSGAPAIRAMEQVGETAVTDAYRKALAPFRQADGRFKVGASFRCLLAQP
ncbi:MAG TPA: class I SAM-dependent methyltransferase [Caulobacteraceae bacterium]|nr:class I SAM-dependent methyltransferase [Caulobacteraceae bacterium]